MKLNCVLSRNDDCKSAGVTVNCFYWNCFLLTNSPTEIWIEIHWSTNQVGNPSGVHPVGTQTPWSERHCWKLKPIVTPLYLWSHWSVSKVVLSLKSHYGTNSSFNGASIKMTCSKKKKNILKTSQTCRKKKHETWILHYMCIAILYLSLLGAGFYLRCDEGLHTGQVVSLSQTNTSRWESSLFLLVGKKRN